MTTDTKGILLRDYIHLEGKKPTSEWIEGRNLYFERSLENRNTLINNLDPNTYVFKKYINKIIGIEILLKMIISQALDDKECYNYSLSPAMETFIDLETMINQESNLEKEDVLTIIEENKNVNDGMHNKYGYSYYDWNLLTKQRQVEILADMAREDINNGPIHWLKEFQKEFPSPKGYSVQLLRYKKKFKDKNRHRHQKFIINGLSFYKGKE